MFVDTVWKSVVLFVGRVLWVTGAGVYYWGMGGRETR